jgi:protein disulfide-isomerase A6
MDAAAKRLIAAPAAERAALLKTLQDEASALDLSADAQKQYVEYYVKTMQRVVEKGDAYVATEAARLAKMAADKGVAPAKREVFEWKANVLASFKPVKGDAASGGKSEL